MRTKQSGGFQIDAPRGCGHPRRIVWDGVLYPTISSAAEACGITASAMWYRIARGYGKPRKKSRRPARLDCEFGGVRYRSIGAMARALGIGWGKARSFAEETRPARIEYAGKKYRSMTALAAAYHLTDTCCIYRLRHNISLEASSVRGVSSRKPCTWEGVDYRSVSAAARACGITAAAMTERLMRRDRPKRPRRKPRRRPCEYQGVCYDTLAEAARALGISRDKACRIVKFYD